MELIDYTGVTPKLSPSPVRMWELHPRKFKDIPYDKVYGFVPSLLLGRFL
jgi:hypothetical protein